MKTLQELATETRRVNGANGWGLTWKIDDLPRNVALIHSEITEAWQERVPHKIARELGDVVIRALDLGELIRAGSFVDLEPERLRFALVSPPSAHRNISLMELHTLTSQVLESFRKVKEPEAMEAAVLSGLMAVVSYAWQLMVLESQEDPADTIDSILFVNSRRAYRHGGRRT
ncbi:hypothetical protein [Deinococcus sp. QL22]|uniref:hypothetical protein n=1 Tax=Deinococcus sp. QL22 TaxID=2939437 RepID=UPI00201803BF|nr:hypothetical protein [Deinococcus sp. QL22]UQN05492.1 hypothetical protein M1R55_11460 [Deinococcus sp. QL22]